MDRPCVSGAPAPAASAQGGRPSLCCRAPAPSPSARLAAGPCPGLAGPTCQVCRPRSPGETRARAQVPEPWRPPSAPAAPTRLACLNAVDPRQAWGGLPSAPEEDKHSRTPGDARAERGDVREAPRRLRAMPHRRPPHPDAPSPVSRRPTPSVWTDCTAWLSARVPPMPGGPARQRNATPPALPSPSRSCVTTTGWSAPRPCLGTLPLRGPPLTVLPGPQGDRCPRATHQPGSPARHLEAGRHPARKPVAAGRFLAERLAPVLPSSLRCRHLIHGALALVSVIRT
jgi:hypothetical protein